MKKWEYIYIEWITILDNRDPFENFMDRINEKGREGWELVSFLETSSAATQAIMKRPITP